MSDKKEPVPGSLGGMYFVSYQLDPLESATVEEINKLLIHLLRAMDIRFGPEEFAKIPPEVRKHFVEHHRDGTKRRFGSF